MEHILSKNIYLIGCLISISTFLSAQISVKGVVTDYETLEPILNVELEIINLDNALRTRTNTEGVFTFEDLPPMVCRLLVSAKGYEDQELKFEAKNNNQFLKIPLFKSAQTNPNETIRQRFDTKVSTASRTFEKLSDAAATVYIFTEQDIAERGYQSLVDILEDVPEIELSERTGELFNELTIRGISGNEKLLLLMDGVRISSGLSSENPIDKNFSIQAAKRVEVLLGPASALYGADAFTGVVNIVTKQGGAGKNATLQTSYGRFNTLENHFRGRFAKRKHAFAINGHYYNSKEPNMVKFFPTEYQWHKEHFQPYGSVLAVPSPDAVDTVVLNSVPFDNSRIAYSFSALYSFGNNLDIGVSHNYQKHASALANRPQFSIYDKNVFIAYAITNIYANHVFQSSESQIPFTLNSTVAYNYHGIPENSKYQNVFSNYQPAYKRAYNHNFRWTENLTMRFNDNQRIALGTSFQYSYALPITSDLADPYSTYPEERTYYLGTNITNGEGRSLAIPQDFYKYKQVNAGGYFQYQNDFTGKLSLTVGMRFDGSNRVRTDGSDAASYLSFNPRLGLVYLPSEKWRFKFFYGSAFLAPSPEKLYVHYGSFVPTQDTAGNNNGFISYFFRLPNPQLNPEVVRSLEFTTQYIGEKLAVSANLYFSQGSQLVAEAPDTSSLGVFKGAPVFFVVRPQNQDDIIAYGGTIRAEYRRSLDPLGNKSLKGYASYSYSDGRIGFSGVTNTTNGLRLFQSAQHTLKAGIHFQIKRFGIDVRAIARTGSYTTDAFNQTKGKGFVLMNVFANYRVIESDKKEFTLDVFLRVRNALDQRYYNTPVSSITVFEFSPQDPVRIGGGITVGFSKKR